VFRHHDDGVDAEQVGVPRHRLRVVAGRHGDHAGSAFGGGQQRQPVGGTAFLEGAGRLQVVQLQHDLGAGRARQGIAAHRRGAQDAPVYPLGGVPYVGQADHVRRTRR
jgi:hypothetical protein